MTALTLAPTAPRRSALDRDVAMQLAAEEYQRVVRVLRALPAEAWSRPTERLANCPTGGESTGSGGGGGFSN